VPEHERNKQGGGKSKNRTDPRANERFYERPLLAVCESEESGYRRREFCPGIYRSDADVPPGTALGPAGAKQYVGGAYKRVPDIRVQIEDWIAEGDCVVVRNHWTGTDANANQRIAFRGIVIWRIADRKIVERWAYLEKPHPADA
jgi:predicted SnoaL-like aldol condensation-catalyzing enzyme